MTPRLRHTAVVLGAALLLALPSLAAPRRALAADTPANPRTAFFHANGLYKDGNFAAAAAEYEQILQSGLASGNVYFNLANAYFKAGDIGRAILNYERTQRLLPGDPDVQANLDYARSLNRVEPCVPPLWQRALFPLAERFSAATLVWSAVCLYSFFFLALAAQRLLPNDRAPLGARPLGYVAAAAAAVAVIVAASCTRRLISDHWHVSAVIVAAGETAARFQPADGGTVHYSLPQGSVVRVLDRREGWTQAARCDGRRGWVPSAALGELWPR